MSLGLHWIIDATDCAAPGIGELAHLRGVLERLPDALGLTRVSSPQVFEHAEPGSGERTLAGLVLIAESHLSVHVRPPIRTVHADIFSCKAFDVALARSLLREAYGFTRHEEAVFTRGEGAGS